MFYTGRHSKEQEPYPRFVVGIDVPVCRNGCDSPHYYDDDYFSKLAGTAIVSTEEATTPAIDIQTLDKTA